MFARGLRNRFASVQAQLLDVEAIRDDVLVLKGGELRAVLEVAGLDLALKSADEQAAVLDAFASLLNGLESPIQLIARAVPQDIQAYLNDLRAPTDRAESEAMVRLRLDHFAFVQALAARRNLLEHRCYAVVAGSAIWQSKSLSPLSLFSKGNRVARASVDAAQRQLAAKTDDLRVHFGAIGLNAHRLGYLELVNLLYEVLAPQQAGRQRLTRDVQLGPVIRHAAAMEDGHVVAA